MCWDRQFAGYFIRLPKWAFLRLTTVRRLINTLLPILERLIVWNLLKANCLILFSLHALVRPGHYRHLTEATQGSSACDSCRKIERSQHHVQTFFAECCALWWYKLRYVHEEPSSIRRYYDICHIELSISPSSLMRHIAFWISWT